MIELFNYFIEANICLLLFGGFYYLFLRKESDLKFRRYFILSTTVLSFLAPFLKFGFTSGSEGTITKISTSILPELVV